MVVVARAERSLVGARQLSLDPPLRRRGDGEQMLLAAQSLDEHEEIRTVEIGLVLVEKARAGVEHARVVAIADRDLLACARIDTPGGLAIFPDSRFTSRPLA